MSKLEKAGKFFLGATSVSGLAVGSVALFNSGTHSEQADQSPQVLNDPELLKRVDELEKKQEENKSNIDKIGSRPGSPIPLNVSNLEEKVAGLVKKVEEISLDVDFNQSQIDKNQAVIINLDQKLKKVEENSFWLNTVRNQLDKLNKKINLYKDNLDKERKDILDLTEHMKEFKNYGDIQNFIEKMRETVSKYNELDKRLVKVEDDFKSIESIALTSHNNARQAFNMVQQMKGLQTID